MRSRSPTSGSSTTSSGAGPEARSQGLFVVLEGPEGAGKTTQAELLTDWLRSRGIPVTRVREPGGTAVGEAIREHVWVPTELEPVPEAELLLVLAARAELVTRVVRPALERGEVVVADRHDLSTLAYQGYGRGLDLQEIRRTNALATGGLRPDIYLLLDVAVDLGHGRQMKAGKSPDRMERAGDAFMRRVHEGYLALAEEDDRVERVDASRGLTEVHVALQHVLCRRFPEWFSPE